MPRLDYWGGNEMGQNNEWSVTITGQGRSGEVLSREGSHELVFYWEFSSQAVLNSLKNGAAEVDSLSFVEESDSGGYFQTPLVVRRVQGGKIVEKTEPLRRH
jgi:hypothetical protein